MILVIDTSGPRWAVAFGDRTLIETTSRPQLSTVYREAGRPDRIAAAIGPGSFTGIRVGVSFALGLAIGLQIPIIPLPSLDLRAARVDQPATAVIEAGRGRVYWQAPGQGAQLGEAADLPPSLPLVGDVTAKTHAALLAAGHRFVPEAELKDFAKAAATVLETASEVPYRNLEIQYMQSFSNPAASRGH